MYYHFAYKIKDICHFSLFLWEILLYFLFKNFNYTWVTLATMNFLFSGYIWDILLHCGPSCGIVQICRLFLSHMLFLCSFLLPFYILWKIYMNLHYQVSGMTHSSPYINSNNICTHSVLEYHCNYLHNLLNQYSVLGNFNMKCINLSSLSGHSQLRLVHQVPATSQFPPTYVPSFPFPPLYGLQCTNGKTVILLFLCSS